MAKATRVILFQAFSYSQECRKVSFANRARGAFNGGRGYSQQPPLQYLEVARARPLRSLQGSVVASYFLRLGWGWAFIAPGLIMAAMAIMVFFWLVVEPADVGYASPYDSSVSSCALLPWQQSCMHGCCRLPVAPLGQCSCSSLCITKMLYLQPCVAKLSSWL